MNPASIWSKLASAHFREEKRDLSDWQNLDDAFVIFIDGNHKTISSGTKDSNPANTTKGTTTDRARSIMLKKHIGVGQ